MPVRIELDFSSFNETVYRPLFEEWVNDALENVQGLGNATVFNFSSGSTVGIASIPVLSLGAGGSIEEVAKSVVQSMNSYEGLLGNFFVEEIALGDILVSDSNGGPPTKLFTTTTTAPPKATRPSPSHSSDAVVIGASVGGSVLFFAIVAFSTRRKSYVGQYYDFQ